MADRQLAAVPTICDFYDQMREFTHVLTESYPDDYYITTFRLMLDSEAIPKPLLIEKFAQYVLPYGHMIASRNAEFFTKDRAAYFGPSHDLGGHMNGAAGLRLSTVWASMEDSERETLWDWFTMFVAIAHKYVNTVRPAG